MNERKLTGVTLRSGLFTSESNIRRIIFDFSDDWHCAVELRIDEPVNSIAQKLETFAEKLRRHESEA